MAECLSIKLENLIQTDNSRSKLYKEDLTGLMTSLKAQGLLQPIGVRKLGTNKYEVVWGNRRLAAAKKLGWVKIDAIEATSVTDEKSALSAHLTENACRVDLSLYDLGRYYRLLKDEHSMDEAEIGARVGVSKKSVLNALEVFRSTPKDFSSKIKNVGFSGGGNKKRVGIVPSSTATTIVNVARKLNLTPEEKHKLFEYAASSAGSGISVATLATLLKTGRSLEESKRIVEGVRSVSLHIPMASEEVSRLEQKHKKKIGKIFLDFIDSEFNTLLSLKKYTKKQSGHHYHLDYQKAKIRTAAKKLDAHSKNI